jgi:hypothetical protein
LLKTVMTKSLELRLKIKKLENLIWKEKPLSTQQVFSPMQ